MTSSGDALRLSAQRLGALVRGIDRWIVPAWILAIATWQAGFVTEGDPYWQIRAGMEALDGVPLVRPDSWSWAPVGGDFYPNSPAWNIVLALAYRSIGFWGLFAVGLISIAICLGLVAGITRRLGAGTYVTLATVLVVATAALPGLSPRAALAAQSLLLAGIWFGAWWVTWASRLTIALALLGTAAAGAAWSGVGNWMHLSWGTLWVLLLLAWVATWSLDPRLAWARRGPLAVSAALGLMAGVLMGPYGPDVWWRSRTVADAAAGSVREWMSPFHPAMAVRWSLVAVLVAVGAGAAAWWIAAQRRRSDRLALLAGLVLPGLVLAVGGLLAVRFVVAAVFVLGPVFGWALARWIVAARARWSVDPDRPGRLASYLTSEPWRVVMTAVLLVLTPFVAIAAVNHARPAGLTVQSALPHGCRLVSIDNDAGPVLLVRPDVLVWVDGRADYWGGQRDNAGPVPAGATCAVANTDDRQSWALVARLTSDPSWQRVAEAGDYVVWVRESSAVASGAD